MGGSCEPKIYLDSIEMIDWRQRSLWRKMSTTLPVPMFSIKPREHLLIVGYTQTGSQNKGSYQLPVAIITSLSSSSDQMASQWQELSPAPHSYTVTVPYSNPPLIIGGRIKGVPTSDISLYDTSKKLWVQVDSLTTARNCVGVASINSNTIIVVGGTSGGEGVEANKASSLSIVELGYIVHN